MEWWIIAILVFLGLAVGLATGIPIAFAFGVVNIVALYILLGSPAIQFIGLSAISSIDQEVYLAIPFFILIGYFFLNTGLIRILVDNLEILLSGVQASLSYVAIVGGLILGALTGVSVASTVALAGFLGPEMFRRGYSKPLTLGPILGAGTMANLIPPTLSSVMIGGMAGISVAGILIGGIIPGVIISSVYSVYCGARVHINPKLAPSTELLQSRSLKDRLRALVNLSPLIFPIFSITGCIMFGIATPTEAGGTGVLATLILAILYRKLNWDNLKEILLRTAVTTSMIYLIMAAAKAYSQMVIISGLGPGFERTICSLEMPPLFILSLIWLVVIILGMFVDQVSVVFLSIPLIISTIRIFNFEPVWIGVTFAMLVGLGGITPPLRSQSFRSKRDITSRYHYEGYI